MDSKTKQAISRIQELQQTFSRNLVGHIDELCQTALQLDLQLPAQARKNQLNLQNTSDLAHKLAGSAGTFQFTEVYTLAKKIEHLCSCLLDTPPAFPDDWSDDWLQLQQLLTEIKLASTVRQPFVTFQQHTDPGTDNADFSSPEHNKIILVDDDELLASLIQEQARHFGYSISCINNPEDLSAFLDKETPAIILMDIVFPNNTFNRRCPRPCGPSGSKRPGTKEQ